MAYNFPNSPALNDIFLDYKWDGEKWIMAVGGVPAVSHSAEAIAFIARTSGLDATHTNAYYALIDGLVADGVWTKLDVLQVYATQDSTTAKLNLVSSSFTGTTNGSPTFTADRGFTGVDSSTLVNILSGFNPGIAPSPKYVRDSAHLSVWSLTNTTSGVGGGMLIGFQNPSAQSNIFSKYNDGKAYFRVNGSAVAGVTNADGRGHYIANRSSSTAIQGYRNGSSVATPTDTSVAVISLEIVVLANNNNGSSATGFGGQVAMASIGSSLSSTDVTNFYNRLRTYMTAVGVP